jgi:hypothetical protein
MTDMSITVCHVDTPEGRKDYLTFLSQEQIFKRGLVGEAIVGVLLRPLNTGESLSPANFSYNRAFVDFLQAVIARRGPALPRLMAAAQRLGQGSLAIVDRRTKTPQGPIPPEDTLGAFQVKDGQIVPNSYRPSPLHLILSKDGFFRLDPELQACLLEELVALLERQAPA